MGAVQRDRQRKRARVPAERIVGIDAAVAVDIDPRIARHPVGIHLQPEGIGAAVERPLERQLLGRGTNRHRRIGERIGSGVVAIIAATIIVIAAVVVAAAVILLALIAAVVAAATAATRGEPGHAHGQYACREPAKQHMPPSPAGRTLSGRVRRTLDDHGSPPGRAQERSLEGGSHLGMRAGAGGWRGNPLHDDPVIGSRRDLSNSPLSGSSTPVPTERGTSDCGNGVFAPDGEDVR